MTLNNQAFFHERFALQVEKRAHEIAFRFHDHEVTYNQVNNKVNRLARVLIRHNMRVGDIAAVDIESPLESAVGILAVIKAGGIYMPLDFDLPREYIHSQLEESKPKFLLTHTGREIGPGFKGNVLYFDRYFDRDTGEQGDETVTFPARETDDPLALVYLGHSSGKPRGIVLSHRNVSNWLTFNIERLKVDFGSTLFIASPTMKAAFPLWLAGLVTRPGGTGGSVCFYRPGKEWDIAELITLMRRTPFTGIVCPLYFIQNLVENHRYRDVFTEAIRGIVSMGEEPFDAREFKRLIKERKIKWYNYFGFPEMSMITTLIENPLPHGGTYIHAGKPGGDVQAHILNRAGRPVAIGLEGELHVSGSGTLERYYRDKALDDAHFSKSPADPAVSVYKTGSRARWLPDGKIAFPGRTDDLVNIRGRRIAIKEVEIALFGHPTVYDCAVVKRGNTLTAYLVFKESDGSVKPVEEYLREQLPPEISPVGFVVLSRMPRRSDGRIDRKYLETCELLDTLQLKAVEKQLERETGIRRAAVLMRQQTDKPVPLHLKDHLPQIKGTPGENSDTAGKSPTAEQKQDETPCTRKPMAVAQGDPLQPRADEPRTLPMALKRAAEGHGDNGIIYIRPDGSEYFQTYPALLEEAGRVLAGLRTLGLKPGDKVIFQFQRNNNFVSAFWGCQLGGFVPVPMAVPRSFAKPGNETATLHGVWQALDKPLVLTGRKLESSIRSFFKDFWVETVEDLQAYEPHRTWHQADPEDLAILLFTSGSTGKPKGVMQCHRSILAREKGTCIANAFSPRDISVNWMPLEHVGGVVMFHLRDVWLGCRQIHARTEYILSNPLKWLEIVTRHKATVTWAPNFAYALLNDLVENTLNAQWELSSMRFILNGGEAVNPRSSKRFLSLLAPYGLPSTAMKPAWGMSETCSGVTYSHTFTAEPGTGVHSLDKRSLTGEIRKSTSQSDSVNFTALGKPIPGFSVRIADPHNRPVEEGKVGRIQVKGPSVTRGYYNNPELNDQVFTDDGWFDTGDLGFILHGRMTITGRAKDVIIVNGINFNSVEIEAAVEEVDGVLTSFTAACAVRDDSADTDRIVIFYSSRYPDFEQQLEQIKEIHRTFVEKFAMNLDYAVPIAQEAVPKTSIGKIQRTKLGKMFEAGTFDPIVKKIDIALENENTLPAWFFARSWARKELPFNQYHRPRDTGTQQRFCLVFEDEPALGDALVPRLEAGECLCIRVKPGIKFNRVSPLHYEMNYREPGHYEQLIRALSRENTVVDDIFHLYNFGPPPARATADAGMEIIEESQYRGVYSLLNLIRALDKEKTYHHPLRLFVISSSVQFTSEDDPVAYEKSTMPGFIKSAALEIPRLQFRHIDLEPGSVSRGADNIIREWTNPGEDKEVAYRGGERLVPCLSKPHLDGATLPYPLKQGGIYLVTGGLGGIGKHLCLWLMKQWRARLVIVGRTPLPPKEEWGDVLKENTENSPLAKRVKAYREIEAAGRDFIYIAGDVADHSFPGTAITRIHDRWGEPPAGVFHLAGFGNLEYHWTVMDRHWVAAETGETFETMFQTKVYGTLRLHQLLAEHNPEALLVAFSSTTAFFGAGTFSAYAAANSFLDAFCFHRRINGFPNTYCLDWSSWDNVGMSENNPGHMVKAMRASGYEMIAPGRGINSLAIALGTRYRQLMIGLDGNKDNIKRHLNEYPSGKQVLKVFYTTAGEVSEKRISGIILPPGKRQKVVPRLYRIDEMPSGERGIDYKKLEEIERNLQYAAVEGDLPRTGTEKALAGIWKEVLGKEQVGVNDNFFELGGHSLKATVVAAKIHKAFDREIPLQEIFRTPTIRELAQFLDGAAAEEYVPVAPVEKKEYYGLSSAQKRLYVLHRWEPDRVTYNIPEVAALEGRLDRARLDGAFRRLIERHESLRTSFMEVGTEPVQRIHDRVDFDIEYTGLKPGDNVQRTIDDFVRPFDLSRAPLLRVGVVETAENRYFLVVDIHHIVADGASMAIIVNDFTAFYSGGELPPLKAQYKDYSQRQAGEKYGESIKRQEQYWLRQLEGEIPVLDLPSDYPRPPVQSFEGDVLTFEMGEEDTGALKALALKEEVTLYILLLSVYNIFLSKLSGGEEVVVGMPISGRRHPDLRQMVGMFVNTLVLRNFPGGTKPFVEFLREVKERTLAAYENQEYPFEDLVERAAVNRDSSRNPLFDVVFSMQNMELPGIEIPGLKLEHREFATGTAKFDITLQVYESGRGLVFFMEYATKLFKRETIERYIMYFKTLISRVLGAPAAPAVEMDMAPEEEKRRLLYDFNDTASAYPKDKTIHRLFEEQAAGTPHRIAAVAPLTADRPGKNRSYKTHMTYSHLDQKSYRLAHLLQKSGVAPGHVVALMTDRSMEMLIGIIGILKAGAAYLPLDLEFPRERIRRMLVDSSVNVLVTRTALHEEGKTDVGWDGETVLIEDVHRAGPVNALTGAGASGLAYIIYTSGTTGMPRGVAVTHGNVVRVVKDTNYIEFTPRDRVLQLSNYAFDGSVFDIYGALLNGAQLVMLKQENVLAVEGLAGLIKREGITVFFVTTALFNTLVDINIGCFEGVRKVLFGGEKVSPNHTRRAFAYMGKDRIIHVYGPTESTVYATYYPVNRVDENESTIPIGLPISNTTAYVLDKYSNLAPIGVAGELYIGGDGLARGYLNRPELTAERFRFNRSYKTYKSYRTNNTFYRTGDLVRRLPGGDIEFIGRIDGQVKIRGFRIELGEIESRLSSHENIKETVVIVTEGTRDDRRLLAAYFTSLKTVGADELREYLSLELPDFMIPSYFVQLETIPLTPNGKIDRKALPEPEYRGEAGSYTAPRDDVESKLVGIWSEILGMDRDGISIDVDFFRLGGHSLKAAVLLSRMHKELDVKVPLAEIFRTPTVEALAKYVKGAAADGHTAVEPVEKREYYRLSPAQKRLYILRQIEGDSTAYNISAILMLEGELDGDRLEETFNRLVSRHESFRTSFEMREREPVQRIHGNVELAIEDYPPTADVSSVISRFIRPFDLSRAPLLRVGLIEVEKGKNILAVDMHHIISDGTSLGILTEEFMRLYAGEKFPPLEIQYKDFSHWQDDLFQSGILERQEAYWLGQFHGEIVPLNLPTDYPRPPVQAFEGKTLGFEIGGAGTHALRSLASGQGVTLYMLLSAVFNVFLSKLGGQDDIIVGTPTAARRHADLQQIVGMFVNTLAMRNFPAGRKSFIQFLGEVKERTLAAFENQEYPFEDLVKKVAVDRDAARNPLFDVLFALQNMDISEIEIPGLKLKPFEYDGGTVIFDLMFQVFESGQGLFFSVGYSTALFKEETVHRFIGYFKNIVTSVLENPRGKVSDIAILSVEEKHRILYDFNDTASGYPRDKTIHQLFEEQVLRTPDGIAVNMSHSTYTTYLTYKELDRQAGRLARLLQSKGIGPDVVVGMVMERSPDMIVGIIGILKAGGAYLPIDPDYPEDRIEFMLADSGARVLLKSETNSNDQNSNDQNGSGTPLVLNFEHLNFEIVSNFDIRISDLSSSNLAYVIYTSGTTGRPKGVLIEHRNVVRLLFNEKFQFRFTPRDVWTLFHSYCFDFSVWEMYGALLYGGRLVIIPKMAGRDARRYLEILERQGVSILNQTPSAFYSLMNLELENPRKRLYIRYVIFGGEALTPARLNGWKEKYPETKLINMYGITETTVHVTFKEITAGEIQSDTRSIGTPIPTLTAYVTDRYLRLLPVGVPGELCVGGKGVGRGYLNRQELTGEKFVDNPYIPGERLYRSGDLVKLTAGGDLEYLGRIDQQVKIRGFRIELGEIETGLLDHDRIIEAVVTAGESAGRDRYLCAYIVSRGEIPLPELRDYLSTRLPEYMIPSYFVFLDHIPLTSNGKTDVKALPGPELKAGESYRAPRDEIESRLAEMWSEILGINKESISIESNFFQLGGHSLKATVLASEIHKAFDVKISLVEIFKSPTVEGLAGYIKGASEDKYVFIKPVEEKEYYALSSAQKRLYILQNLAPGNVSYNMPGVVVLEGAIETGRFEETFRALIRRHESLRTSFFMKDNRPVQRIHRDVEFKIDYYRSSDRLTPNRYVVPFDLSAAPLLRVILIREEEERHILFIDMHHIISDGTSMDTFLKEFMTLYGGEEPEPLTTRYRDYSQWRNREKESVSIKEQESYWLGRFADEIPVLDLPLDYPRPLVEDAGGSSVTVETGEKETELLKALALKGETTLFMVLLSVFNILLAKLGGREDIVVGSPIAGRRHAGLNRVIGMFVNTLALRNSPAGDKTFISFLREVKEVTLAAYENQEYPFEDLVEKAGVTRNAGRNPLFDVMFALQNADNTAVEIPGLTLKPYEYKTDTAKFDLTLQAYEAGKTLRFAFEFRTRLFKSETVLCFAHRLSRIIEAVCGDPRVRLSDIDILTDDERRRLLYEYNKTETPYPRDKTIPQLFEEQVLRTPDGIAVNMSYRTYRTYVTYKKLDREAGRLACLLQSKGIGPDTIVGIMMERSLDMIVGIMGILKAGGAYLPIDPTYPEERIDFMLKDSNAKILLSELSGLNELHATRNSQPATIFSNLAYVIYTSGTTGKPKGILTTHANAVRVVKETNYIELTPGDRVLQLSNYAFDGSVFDIYGALLNGSALVMVSKEDVRAVDMLADLIVRETVTVFFVTTALFNTIVDTRIDCLAGIRKVLFGGEKVSVAHSKKALEYMGGGRVIHVYGPTETTVYAAYYPINSVSEDESTIPIGLPIANTDAYVLDKYTNLVPNGVTGELYIGGDGLARGYLNRPELTAEKFRNKTKVFGSSEPFFQKGFWPPEALYRTGDLVRRRPDGQIEFQGRIDGQVKIRGFRIELKEIESRLLTHPEIKDAVVVAREEKPANQRYLCGYFVSGRELSISRLRDYLSQSLPDYMVPLYFVPLGKIPLNSSGKIDRKALPVPGAFQLHSAGEYAAPGTGLEKTIAGIWRDVLKLEKVGIDDNFFDIGGNSLNIIQVNEQLNRALETEFPVVEMFRYTTIRSLGRYLDRPDREDNLDRKKRSEALQRGKNDRRQRYQKRKQKKQNLRN